ncbi:MAG: hypothetical protein ABR525_00295 [Candidatus Limnocylindria bacterium]
MMLVAWGYRVGSNSVGFGGLEGVRPLLRIPEDIDVVAIVPLGHPAVATRRGKKNRRPLAEVAHLERYGAPFPSD